MEKRYFVIVYRRTSDCSILVSEVYTPEKLFFANPLEFSRQGLEFISVSEIILPNEH